jgi:outer membrane biosynthesis protein TonB
MDSTFFAFQHSPDIAPMDLDADMVNPWASGNDLSQYIVPQTAPFPQMPQTDIQMPPPPDVQMPPPPDVQMPPPPDVQMPPPPDVQMPPPQPDVQMTQHQPDVPRSSQPQPANPPTTVIPGGFDIEDDTGSVERMSRQDSGRNRRALTAEIETSHNKARLVENDYSAMLRSQLRGARKGAQLAREDTIRNTVWMLHLTVSLN